MTDIRSAEFVGVCDAVDWQALVDDLVSQTPGTQAPLSGIGYKDVNQLEEVSRPDDWDATINLWEKAGYKNTLDGGNSEWLMFYPGLNFDERIVEIYCDFLNVSGMNACWISMIRPGMMAPWHIDQHELKNQNKTRYHTHIGAPQMGHIFMMEDDYFINQPQGATYKWNDVYAWHAGINGGKTPKFMLNFI